MNDDRLVPRVAPKLVAGVLLILVGILFAVDHMTGLIEAGDLFDYWPLILVGIGITKLANAREQGERVGGIVLLSIGGLFLLNNLEFLNFRLRSMWPFLLLVIGGALIWQALRRSSAPRAAAAPSGERAGSRLDEFAIMGGGDRVITAQDFQGGEVVAIMAGFEIDLRQAAISGEEAKVEVFTLWGGIDFKVPEEWEVVVRGTPILGVFTNSARPKKPVEGPRPRFIVEGLAIMGGVEIKN